jgi:hypothetical protein
MRLVMSGPHEHYLHREKNEKQTLGTKRRQK